MNANIANPKRVKALGMISGGLDSTLATKVLMDLGIEIEGVHFSTGFCVTEHTRHFKDPGDKALRPNEALRLASELKFKVHLVDISKDYLPVVTSPKYGYGSNMNPCIDCRIFMFKKMRGLMETFGADFIYTGEVLGQRPMSQHRQAMKTIEMDSGLAGLVLRPLSAKLLDPTIPEIKGWVDRSKLLDLSGRSRKPQMRLAEESSLENYPQPAGGCCFLADPQYSKKLEDFFRYNDKSDLTHEDVILLKVGRHLRISEKIKVIVGRNERENNFLKCYEKNRHVFRVPDFPSAHLLSEAKGGLSPEESQLLASIAARYSDNKGESAIKVEHLFGEHQELLNASAVDEARLEQWRI